MCYKVNMRSIGIRELRQEASRYLRAVEAGETIQVTDRGRPVALLSPITRAGTLAQLEAEGRLIRGTGALEDLGPPLESSSGQPLLSDILARLREDER